MKKIVIVGAGISGMAAGIYGQLNGFDTEIYEQNLVPGGECTGWSRGQYHFDGCIHWLVGSKAGTAVNQLWREIGALDDSVGVVTPENFYRVEDKGKAVNIYRNVDRLEEHLIETSPQDEPLIRETCNDIRAVGKLDMPIDKPMDMYSTLDNFKMMARMLPSIPLMRKYNAITIGDLIDKFKHPFIRDALTRGYPRELTAILLLMVLASRDSGDSGIPLGGSKKFAERIAKRYTSLGGKIHYNTRVNKIKVVDGKAEGIILKDGTECFGDIVVSAADGYFTLTQMLESKYMDDKLHTLYSDREKYVTFSSVNVFFGINCDLSNEPHWLFFRPSHKVNAGGITHEWLGLTIYSYDKSFAPLGKSVVAASMLAADYDWWKQKHQDKDAYRAEKERLAAEVRAAIEERYPQTKGRIEVVDVATPMTYERFCNAWRGCYMSWGPTPKSKIKSITGRLAGLHNFYMTGQWTMLPGINGAAITGKWTIQRICRDFKETFKPSSS